MILAVALALLLPFAAQAQPDRPNVVFILADDLGWADLGVYGADLHRTPRLDAFAETAVRFTQAYAASPVCSPTRASILTGKEPARLHLTIWREAAHNPPLTRKLVPPRTMDHLPLAETTLAEALRAAGYSTHHVGKWHLGRAEQYPQNQGFDSNIGGTLWGAPQTFFYPYSGDRLFREPRYVPHLEGGSPGEYLTDRLTDEALKILERERDRPFYLNLWYHTVHTPIEGKPEIAERFARAVRPELKHRNPHYAAMVYSLDENVGRLLDKLEELGLAEETIVVFSSDNGGYVNQYDGLRVTDNRPLRSGKGSLWEGGIRVPTMIRWPGRSQSGAVCGFPVSSIDFYPSLLAMTGVPDVAGHRSDGIDISPLLVDPSAELDREALFFHYPHYYATTAPASAVRVGDWKLLEFYEDGRRELYNLAEDLSEENDLAERRPELADQLSRRLHAWLESVDAQLPSPR